MRFQRQSGAIHILGIGTLIVLLAVLWIFMGWQQHIDRVHAQVEVMKQRMEMLELRLKVIESKLNM